MLSCGGDGGRTRGAGSGDLRPVDEPPEAGRLRARPGPAEIGGAAPAGVHRLDLAGGTALLYVPAGHQPDRPSPLAVMFHGAGGTADDGLALLRPLADEAGLMLLAPDSQGRTWDLLLDGYGPDAALVDDALEEVFGNYAVDPAAVAVGGFSDGASYALSIGATNGDLFTHVLAFSPGFWAPASTRGSPSFFVTHGTDDTVLPIASTSRRLVPALKRTGYEVSYHEFDGGHVVPGDLAAAALVWFLRQG